MICHVTVRTPKLSETVDFYNWLLGMTVARRLTPPTGEIVFMGEAETKFEIIQDDKAEVINAKGLTVGFTVESLEEKLAMLDGRRIPHSPVFRRRRERGSRILRI